MADNTIRNRYLAALNPAQRQADTAENYFLDKATSFDPTAALETYGQAAYGDFQKGLKRNLADLGSSAVGAGRFDTGFYDEDQGRLITDMTDQYQRDLASHAMEAAGLEERNTEAVGQFGQNTRNTYLDLLTGELDRQTAEQNAKKSMWGDILKGGLGVAGTVLGAVL